MTITACSTAIAPSAGEVAAETITAAYANVPCYSVVIAGIGRPGVSGWRTLRAFALTCRKPCAVSASALDATRQPDASPDYYEQRARDTLARARQVLGAEQVESLCELAVIFATQSTTIDLSGFEGEVERLRA